MVSKVKSSDLFILLVTFGIFFMTLLGSHALLNPDEGRYSEIAREMLVRGDYITPYLNGIVFLDKPILFYWLEIISLKLFGLQEWSLRLWPALFGILGCLMMYVSGCLLFNRRTGILSAFILSTTTLYFLSAHYVNMDLEVAVLITGALLSFIVASQNNYDLITRGLPWAQSDGKLSEGRSAALPSDRIPGFIPRAKSIQFNKKILLLAYMFSGLAVLTKGLIGIVIPALVICLWGICLKHWNLLLKIYLPTGLLLVLVIAAPWYILAQQATPEFFHYFFVTQHFSRFLTHDFNGHQPFWFYVPVILIGFFPWTVFLLQMLVKKIGCVWKEPETYSVELFFIFWLLVVFLFFSMPSSKIIGYILPVFPPMALLVGNYLDTIWDRPKHSGFFAFIILAFFIAFSLIGLIYYAGQDFVVTNHFIQANLLRLNSANYYFYCIAGLLIFSGIIALLQLHRKTILGGLLPIFISTGCLFFIFLCAMPKIHLLSTKVLAVKLSSYLRPEDIVISYHQYYQDLPFYLQRRITVVDDWNSADIGQTDNWRRELWVGSHYRESHEWLVDDKDFERYFRSGHPRFFIFTDPLSFKTLVHTGHKLYLLDEVSNILLLSNKKTQIK